MRRHFWILPLAALLAVAPLLYDNGTCANDIGFHLQSWYDAAAQLLHGNLYPRWTFAAAYNMGEPRFTFYPPISWQLGRLLYFLFPPDLLPIAMAWLALALGGFAMHHLARQWVSARSALTAAILYIANPYLLFSVYHRSSYGELFASAACPLLFAAMLAPRFRPARAAIALALIWLSDVPAAILATYLFALLATYRLTRSMWQTRSAPRTIRLQTASGIIARSTLAFALTLGLAAVFLVPALAERSRVRMQDAYPLGMRPVDNLLLHRTLLAGRDDFLISIAHLALAFAVMCAAAFTTLWLFSNSSPKARDRWFRAGRPLAAISAILLFSFTFLAQPFWSHLPALWATQFPWRGLYLLAVCLTLAIALCLDLLPQHRLLPGAALLLLTVSAVLAGHTYRFRCTRNDTPAAFYARLARHHTPSPTDEYIPSHANPGSFRPDNPPFWLTPDVQSYAPDTTTNRVDLDPEAEMPQPAPNAVLQSTPLDLDLTSPCAQFLVLNLEDYPNWSVSLNGALTPLAHRADGLIAITVPAGTSHMTVRWHHGWDEYTGWLLSLASLLYVMRLASSKRLPPSP